MLELMIRVSNLIKSANGTRILRGVSFEVPPRTVLGIIGGSGSGKTTLLRCLNGLERIDEGSIDCHDIRLEATLSKSEYARRVAEMRRKVGTVFQHLYLFPHLSVVGNIIEAPVHVAQRARARGRFEYGAAFDLQFVFELRSQAPTDLHFCITSLIPALVAEKGVDEWISAQLRA